MMWLPLLDIYTTLTSRLEVAVISA